MEKLYRSRSAACFHFGYLYLSIFMHYSLLRLSAQVYDLISSFLREACEKQASA